MSTEYMTSSSWYKARVFPHHQSFTLTEWSLRIDTTSTKHLVPISLRYCICTGPETLDTMSAYSRAFTASSEMQQLKSKLWQCPQNASQQGLMTVTCIMQVVNNQSQLNCQVCEAELWSCGYVSSVMIDVDWLVYSPAPLSIQRPRTSKGGDDVYTMVYTILWLFSLFSPEVPQYQDGHIGFRRTRFTHK